MPYLCEKTPWQKAAGARIYPPDASHRILETQRCRLGDVEFQFSFEPEFNRINLYADIGKPNPADEHRIFKTMLEIHMEYKAPASWILGLNAQSGHVVLVSSYFISGEDPDEPTMFPLQLELCARIAQGLRANLIGH